MSTATTLPADMTVPEYAGLVRVSERTVYRWAREGKIPIRRYGRVIRVRPEALDGFDEE